MMLVVSTSVLRILLVLACVAGYACLGVFNLVRDWGVF
jgi:hypothetical protein